LPNQSCNNVSRPAWRITNDDTHRPHGIGLCLCEARSGWERGSARRQLQKFAAEKFHHIASRAPSAKQKVSEPKQIYFRIARPPPARALPLISRNVGVSRWQL